jgi:hypothetical protein
MSREPKLTTDHAERESEVALDYAEALAALDRGEGCDLDEVLAQARSIVEAAEVKRAGQSTQPD